MEKPLPEDFDGQEAIWCACASNAVYDCLPYNMEAFKKDVLIEHPEAEIESMSDSARGTRAVVVTTRDRLLIAFRGTNSFKNFIQDISVGMLPFYRGDKRLYGIRVHEGFLNDHDLLWPELKEFVTKALYRNLKIFVTGHSLGAAMAAICAARIYQVYKESVTGYTFGQPRVGNMAWHRWFEANIPDWYRMIHRDDVVCRIPWIGRAYWQVKNEIFFDANNQWHVEWPWYKKLPSDIRCMWRKFYLDPDVLLEDHACIGYLDLMQSTWGPKTR